MSITQEPTAKAKSFTDLIAWREGHALVLMVYRMTKAFPKEEIFGLTSQVRRASVSITSNIAEGFTRQTKADKVHFYTMALASLSEVQNQSLVARDIEYLGKKEFDELAERSIRVSKLLNGLIRSIKSPATHYLLPATPSCS